MNYRQQFLQDRLVEYLHKMPDASPDEISDLKNWVKEGNDPYDNPFMACNESGFPMDFISAIRFEKERFEDFSSPKRNSDEL